MHPKCQLLCSVSKEQGHYDEETMTAIETVEKEQAVRWFRRFLDSDGWIRHQPTYINHLNLILSPRWRKTVSYPQVNWSSSTHKEQGHNDEEANDCNETGVKMNKPM